MLSPVPFKEILDGLIELTVKMSQYPRMHCKPAQAHKPTQGHKDNSAVKALKTQQRITATLAVLCQACRLENRKYIMHICCRSQGLIL